MEEYAQIPDFDPVAQESDLQGDALITGWNAAKMFKMTFANFKAMILNWVDPPGLDIKLGDEVTEMAAGQLIYNLRLKHDVDFNNLPEFNSDPDPAKVPAGSLTIFDVHLNGVTVFSTKPTVDDGDSSSADATTPAVLSITEGNKGDNVTIFCDQPGATRGGTAWTFSWAMRRKIV